MLLFYFVCMGARSSIAGTAGFVETRALGRCPQFVRNIVARHSLSQLRIFHRLLRGEGDLLRDGPVEGVRRLFAQAQLSLLSIPDFISGNQKVFVENMKLRTAQQHLQREIKLLESILLGLDGLSPESQQEILAESVEVQLAFLEMLEGAGDRSLAHFSLEWREGSPVKPVIENILMRLRTYEEHVKYLVQDPKGPPTIRLN